MKLQRLIGAAVLLGFLGLAKVAGAEGFVVVELGADIQEFTTPQLESAVTVIRAAGGVCHSISNARPMGEGLRIACDQLHVVYYITSANGVIFVSDITESGR